MECRRRCNAAQHRASTRRRLSSPVNFIVSLVAVLVLADAVPSAPNESGGTASGDAALHYTMPEEQPVGSLVANLLTDTNLEAALSSTTAGSSRYEGLVFEVFEGYHTIGRYLALPTGSIRAGQNSPYFANYMQEGKYGPGKYDFIFARLLFPNLFRRRLLPSPICKQLRFCPQVHYIKNSSARLTKEVRGLQANDVMLAPPI
jgi:hypothetical protein